MGEPGRRARDPSHGCRLGSNATIESRPTPYSPVDAPGLLVNAHQEAQRLTRAP